MSFPTEHTPESIQISAVGEVRKLGDRDFVPERLYTQLVAPLEPGAVTSAAPSEYRGPAPTLAEQFATQRALSRLQRASAALKAFESKHAAKLRPKPTVHNEQNMQTMVDRMVSRWRKA